MYLLSLNNIINLVRGTLIREFQKIQNVYPSSSTFPKNPNKKSNKYQEIIQHSDNIIQHLDNNILLSKYR